MNSLVLFSVFVLGVLALIFGFGLAYAAKVFFVREDERVSLVREQLGSANCGACSFVGCDDYARAVAAGHASILACPVISDAARAKIADVMGVKTDFLRADKKKAVVLCAGDAKNSRFLYRYDGLKSCEAAACLSYGGSKQCRNGCLGEGSCEAVCKFGAISVTDGLARVDSGKCTGCGVCVAVCPKKIIALIPETQNVYVACSCAEDAKTVTAACDVGCIGCALCKKTCPPGAVLINGRLAKISADKCVSCGECVKKCPRKIIHIEKNFI